jgi:hypothetical protein
MSEIASAIVTGPVKYAGGALVTGRVFEYGSATKSILIPNDLWIELSHLGYWVSQAVILQWAEKTTSLGKGIDVASVVGLGSERLHLQKAITGQESTPKKRLGSPNASSYPPWPKGFFRSSKNLGFT